MRLPLARYAPVILVVALLLQACAGGLHDAKEARSSPTAWRGPVVVVDPSRVADTRDAACARITPLLIPIDHYANAALSAGMLPDDFAALRTTIDGLNLAVTFRDSNQACAPHLRAGLESKGHDVMTKTFTAESLPKGFEWLAGTVSTLEHKPKAGEMVSDPMSKRYFDKKGEPLTCDYDMMDIIATDGSRIEGESAQDLELRGALNAALPPRGAPPRHVDRIKHGAQAGYPSFLRAVARAGRAEKPHFDLMQPEKPLTLFDQEGKVYRFNEVEDALNYYRCAGAGLPPEGNVQTR